MARRKKRETNIPVHETGVDVHRNKIESTLMAIGKFTRSRKKIVLIILVLLIILCGGGIFGALRYDKMYNASLLKFEQLWDRYQKLEIDSPRQEIETLISDMKMFEDDAIGSLEAINYYVLGDLNFRMGNNKESRHYYNKYINGSTIQPFGLIAQVNVAISYQNEKEYEKALNILTKLEEEYANKNLENYVIFNLANVYVSKNDLVRARTYFNRLITLYPGSPYARKAKKILLQLSSK